MIKELEDLPVYSDGSAMAAEVFAKQIDHLREQHQVIELMETFLANHQQSLWGMRFTCCSVWPRIELWWTHYRGKLIRDPRQIARLWPEAQWERERNEYREHEIDWFCTVDGVKLLIKGAESTKPAAKPKISGSVEL